MAMRSLDFRRAALRLENVNLPSPTTEAALRLIEQNPSESFLIDCLGSRKQAGVALTVLSASQSESEAVFDAVVTAIHRDPYISWALVESLNELPWYNGLRAFLSLPDDPCTSPVAYPFYILARNKAFVTPDSARERYDHHVKGLWGALAIARDQRWSEPDTSVVTVVELFRSLLDTPRPDPFIVYFASLLFGQVAPRPANMKALQARLGEDCCPAVQATVALALRHIGSDRVSMIRFCPHSQRRNSKRMIRALAALVAF